MSASNVSDRGGENLGDEAAKQLDRLAESYMHRLRGGERPSIDGYVVQHPQLATQIRELFPVLEMLETRPPLDASDGTVARRARVTRFQPGTVLGNRYEISELVGVGGMGEVYRARDNSLDREVAIKTLIAHRAIDPESLLRFQREAKALAALSHPNVLFVYDIGEHAGLPFVVMEFVRGCGLGALLDRSVPDMEQIAQIGRQIAAGLAAAHQQGIVHRDIKPHNVFMLEDGRIKVLDFGLARLQYDGAGNEGLTLTSTGVMPGTAAYMSPEQALGQPVTTASDIFSLGTLLYELATGHHPFRSDSAFRTMQMIIEQDPRRASQQNGNLPEWFDDLLTRMLHKDLNQRPSAAQVQELLEQPRTGALDSTERRAELGADSTLGDQPNPTSDATVSYAPSARLPRRVLGEFELQGIIGSGGMAVVYRARQATLGRDVALKCMRSGNDKWTVRFRREMQALGAVKHPNLVEIYSSGSADGQSFYAMEFIDGADLTAVCKHLTESDSDRFDERTWRSALTVASDAVRARERAIHDASTAIMEDVPESPETLASARDPAKLHESPAYVRQIVRTILQITEALHALHQAGIVHRDVKPGNIMLTRDGGRAVLIDPGIARLMEDTDHRLTRTHEVVGTLLYASPEQVLSVGTLDHRSDIYSLGATLWELLTFRPLFGQPGKPLSRKELMHRIEVEDPAPLRKHNRAIPSDLEAIVQKCLEKNPDRRYANADMLAADLRDFLDGKPVSARPVGLMTRSWRTIGRRPMLMYCSGGLALGAMFGAAVLLPFGNRPSRQSPAAASDPRLMRIGIKPWVGYCPLIVAYEKGWCDPLRIELVPVTGLEDMRRLLDRQEIDVAMWMVDTHVLARSSGIATKVVLKLDHSLEADAIVARPQFRSFNDLVGKKVTYQHQEASHFLLLALCEKYGLDPDQLELLATSARGAAERFIYEPDIAAAVTYDPHLFNAMNAVPGAHRLASGADVPGAIVDILTVREDYLESHREAVVALLRGWFQAVEVLKDRRSADHDDAVSIACRFYDEYAPRDNGTAYTPQDYYTMESGMQYAGLEENLDYFRTDRRGDSRFRRHFTHAQERWGSHHQMGTPTRAADGDGSAILFEEFGSKEAGSVEVSRRS